MKGFLKVGLALGAVAAGTAWALRRYAPETYAELRGKAVDAVKKLVPREMELTVEDGDTTGAEDTAAVDPELDPAFAVDAEETAEADADANAEEWPDLSQMPEDADHPAD